MSTSILKESMHSVMDLQYCKIYLLCRCPLYKWGRGVKVVVRGTTYISASDLLS